MPNNFNLYELLKQNFGRYQYKEDLSDPAAIIRGLAQRDSTDSQAAWLLERTTIVAGELVIEYADDARFTQVWDDRLLSFPAAPTSVAKEEDVVYDTITLTEPNATTEEYRYFLSGTQVLLVTFTYTSPAKTTIVSVVRS